MESWEGQAGVRFVRGMSLELMAAADAAVVASGTATLECALLGTPMVVVYSMSELSYQFAKRVAKVPYASLVNLMAGTRLVREFIHDFSVDDVSAEVLSLLRGPAAPQGAARQPSRTSATTSRAWRRKTPPPRSPATARRGARSGRRAK